MAGRPAEVVDWLKVMVGISVVATSAAGAVGVTATRAGRDHEIVDEYIARLEASGDAR